MEKTNADLKMELKEELLSKRNLQRTVLKMRKKLNSNCESLTAAKLFHIMSPIFTETQISKIISCKKKISWKNDDICKAFTLRYLGKRTYLYLRETLKMPLPAISTWWASKFELR